MTDRKTLGTILVFALGAGASFWFLGTPGLVTAALAGIGVVATARFFDLIGAAPLWPFNKQMNMAIMLVAAIGLIATTPFLAAQVGGMLNPAQASLTGNAAADKPVSQSDSCAVPDGLVSAGSATVSFRAVNVEADKEETVNVPISVFADGQKVADLDDTHSGDTVSVAPGKTLSVRGGNTTSTSAGYYLEAVEGYCVDEIEETVDLNAHEWQTATNMEMTIFDDTGATALSSDTNSDYTAGDLGADALEPIFVKIENDANNDRAYNFYGFAVAVFNDIDEVAPVSGYSTAITPKYLEDQTVRLNSTYSAANTIEEDYKAYTRDAGEVMMQAWDSEKVKFQIDTDDSTAPSDADGTANLDGFAISVLDSAGAEDASGKVVYDFYQHDEDQGNVGLTENLTAVHGKNTAALVTVE